MARDPRSSGSSGVGRRTWAIAEGYIPASSTGPAPDLTSHEAICILNTGPEPAQIAITIFFTDRDPVGPYAVQVPARRSKHIRVNDLADPESIPAGVEYSSLIESDVPIVVQHTRLDSRQPANALLSTIAFSAD